MSKEGNFTRYVCDRPASAHKDGKERREYVKDGDGSKLSKWHQVPIRINTEKKFPIPSVTIAM